MKFYFSIISCFLFLNFLTNLTANKVKLASQTNTEFNSIVNFLETSNKQIQNPSEEMFKVRVSKMRRKKEIIIRKIYEYSPLIGEILALSNIEKINLILTKFFIVREREVLKKFIIMLGPNSNYIDQSSKVLLNLIVCTTNFNQLRCILNFLLEGLCKGDDRSILIFKEIVTTMIIDTLIRTKFYYYQDLQAKFNLVRILNTELKFKPITKIEFVDSMMLTDNLKEIITFIIMKYKTNEDVEALMNDSIHEIPSPLVNNTRLFEFVPSEKDNSFADNSSNDVATQLQKEAEDSVSEFNSQEVVDESATASKNIQALVDTNRRDIRFKEKMLSQTEIQLPYNEAEEYNPGNLPSPLKVKLNDIKNHIKNHYAEFLYNQTHQEMPLLQEEGQNFQMGMNKRSIYPKYKVHLYNLIALNDLLEEFPRNYGKGSVIVSEPKRDSKVLSTTITSNVAPGLSVSMHFKQKDNSTQTDVKSPENKKEKSQKSKEKGDNKVTPFRFMQKSRTDFPLSQSTFAVQSLNLLQHEDDPNNFKVNHEQLTDSIIQNSNDPELVSVMTDKNIKVYQPKEIHTMYEIERNGTRIETQNKDSKNSP